MNYSPTVREHDGKWRVVSGETVLAEFPTQGAAWRWLDRHERRATWVRSETANWQSVGVYHDLRQMELFEMPPRQDQRGVHDGSDSAEDERRRSPDPAAMSPKSSDAHQAELAAAFDRRPPDEIPF
jgi:hypothetical protein